MNTSARYSFAAGIALACGAFALTAATAAPATAPTPEPTTTVTAAPTPEPTAAYAPAEAPTPVVVQDAPLYDDNPAPASCADGEAMAEDGSCVPLSYWDDEPTATAPTYTLPPCEYEDSDNCYWDAATRGNGQGTSFINLNGTTYYPEGN